MHKVFISYHDDNDWRHKDALVSLNDQHQIFIDQSVDTGDVDPDLPDESIRQIIRDDYLRDSTVTILLVGIETARRKHIDWEVYSSMYNGLRNKKSGILVINLPSTGCTNFRAAHGDREKEIVHPETSSWTSIKVRTELEVRYSCLPARVIDNLLAENVRISVVPWDKVTSEPDKLAFLIDASYDDRTKCEYDLSRPMRRRDS